MVQIATMINTGNDMQQLKDDHRNHLLIFPVNKNRRKIWGQIKDSPRYDDR